MTGVTKATRPSKDALLTQARSFVTGLCGPVRELRREYAARNIATQLDRAWKEWERAQKEQRSGR